MNSQLKGTNYKGVNASTLRLQLFIQEIHARNYLEHLRQHRMAAVMTLSFNPGLSTMQAIFDNGNQIRLRM